MQRLGQVWGLGELKCKCNKSPNKSLEPTLEQLKPNQMGSNPNANLNHHMKCHDKSPCEVTRSTDKVKLHDVLFELHLGCYTGVFPAVLRGRRRKNLERLERSQFRQEVRHSEHSSYRSAF